jgi:uncharacterized protein (DUF1684 family)
MRRFLLITLIAGAACAAATWREDVAHWREKREADLRAPGGWLSVSGLFWLHEGANTVGSDPASVVVLPAGTPRTAGVFRLSSGKASFEPASGPKLDMKPDDPGPPTIARIGNVMLTVINRGDKFGVRMKDPDAATRREFTGCIWYPIEERWRIRAKWTPYNPPKKIPILNIIGMTSSEDSPGVVEFTLSGKTMRLEPIVDDGELFFLFRDQTSGKTTYPAGRFLYAAMPKDGFADLDFNKAENPPCAFTAYATCPLPPKSNTLAMAVEAGEKRPTKHP